MKIKLALEWFLNPDHLPFLVAKDKGLYKKLNIDLEIIEPDDHYDGFLELEKENIQFATNEPLHLIEKYHENILSVGNFFETSGGIIFSKNGYEKFLNDQAIKITSPVSNQVTDTIALDILKRHKENNSIIRKNNVEIVVKDFFHIKNLKDGFDAAWLCFENFEGVESKLEGLEIERVYLENVKIPNFCALDLFTSKQFYQSNSNFCKEFKIATEEAISIFYDDIEYSQHVFYSQSKQEKSKLMDSIIKDSINRFITPFQDSKRKWKELHNYITQNKISNISEEQYNKMFINYA